LEVIPWRVIDAYRKCLEDNRFNANMQVGGRRTRIQRDQLVESCEFVVRVVDRERRRFTTVEGMRSRKKRGSDPTRLRHADR
jgi:hypothetical protein